MKFELGSKPAGAMTAFEALVVIAMLALFAAVLLPELAVTKRRASLITCNRNVKEINLAFKIWENDHGNKLPMQYAATNDALIKAVTNGGAWHLWQTMSNELGTPKILHCPADLKTTFGNKFAEGISDANISYFFNLDAADAKPRMVLDGDDNLAVDGLRAAPGILSLRTNDPVSWTKERHYGNGNIGLTDGSVMPVANNGLNAVLVDSGTNIARLVIP